VTENQTATTLGHANPNRQRDKSKQTRDSGERQEGKNLLLIDMSIPTERNTSLKIMEKLAKHKDLVIEIKKTWGMKTTVPVINGAFGLVKKRTENYISKISDNIRITELQKTVLLGTACILSRTLSIK